VARVKSRTAAAKGLALAAAVSLLAATMTESGIADTTVGSAEMAVTASPGGTRVDLSHLVYTARVGLVAHAVSPDDGGVVNTVATSFEVATIIGAGVEIAVNGKIVPPSKLGRRVEFADGTVRYTYYGVVLAPGKNEVALTPLGVDGLRGPSVVEGVWGPGAPATIRATGCAAPRADGRTPCAVQIAVVDRWGHPAAPGATLKVSIASGDAAIVTSAITGGAPIADTLPGTVATSSAGQRSIVVALGAGSTAMIPVVPGNTPGRIQLAAAVNELTTGVELDVMAYARPAIVTGLATVGIGAVPGQPGTDPTIPDGTDSRRGRVALYAAGLLSGDAVGSLAYDTAGPLAPTTATGTFEADPDDQPYATYGDASIRRDDALTQDKLFARVDDGHTSAMWGQFEATTGPQDAAGAVAMQVDGARVAVGSTTVSASGFSAENRVGYGRQVLNPSGLAILETLSHDNLVVGSEAVTLVTLDRRTGVILSQSLLQNSLDYTIDYTSGIIHFINIPLPYDAAFNPQQILVTYEYSATNGGAQTTGGRLDAALGHFDGVKLGLGYLNDSAGAENFTLVTENAGGLLPGGSWSASHASSNGFVPGASNGTITSGAGSALRVAGASSAGPYKLSFGYDTTSPAFGDPFGGLASPGLTDYHAALIRTIAGQGATLSFSYDRETNTGITEPGVSSAESNLAALLSEKLNSQFTVRAGIAMHQSETDDQPEPEPIASAGSALSAAAPGAMVMQADVGADWKASKQLGFSVDRDETIGGFDPTQPAQTTAQASWDLSGRGRIYARELWSAAPAQTFAASTAGLTTVASATHAFALGIEQNLSANTSVDSEYQVAGTGNGTDVNAAIGVRERLIVSPDLKGDAFVQRGAGIGPDAAGFAVYGLSFAYGAPAGWLKATSSLQDRTGEGGGATWSLGAAGKLDDQLALLESYEGSRALGSNTSDARVALAWRPSTSDRGAVFAGYERAAGNAAVAGDQSGVLSVDGVFRPAGGLEFTGRYARKIDGDSSYAVGTSLLGVGVRQRIGRGFDVGLETREVLAPAAGGGLHSTAAELGTMLGGTLRAAVGYNFGATADPTLAAAPTKRGVYVTLTTVIDRILGWGAH